MLCLSGGRTFARRRYLVNRGHKLLEGGEVKANVDGRTCLHPNFETREIVASEKRCETERSDWRAGKFEIVSDSSPLRARKKHNEKLRLSNRRQGQR